MHTLPLVTALLYLIAGHQFWINMRLHAAIDGGDDLELYEVLAHGAEPSRLAAAITMHATFMIGWPFFMIYGLITSKWGEYRKRG
jgi:hypothetical protein